MVSDEASAIYLLTLLQVSVAGACSSVAEQMHGLTELPITDFGESYSLSLASTLSAHHRVRDQGPEAMIKGAALSLPRHGCVCEPLQTMR